MSNSYFQFKQFRVSQDRCAMKVGTDGTLLGAWARGGRRILDIGTGTGLIALMMAQRFPQSLVTAVDIDDDAVSQAVANVAASPFAGRVVVKNVDIRTMQLEPGEAAYDAIVANPPYFNMSLKCPDSRRTMARHTDTLSYRDLMTTAHSLLDDRGEMTVVIPSECKDLLESEALQAGLSKVRECAVRTVPRKQPRRYLMAFAKHPAPVDFEEGVLETAPGVRSPWYTVLTKAFYL
jgi:tRNA1Val (adenine37-N6)-methyltransferase